MYYCSFMCSLAGAMTHIAPTNAAYRRRSTLGPDPTAWDTRCAHPITSKANVAEAFTWLDVRATR